MESTASIIGAFDAHKLPTQAQTNAWIQWLVCQIDEVTSSVSQTSGKPQLSEHGLKLGIDVKRFLLAYKELGDHKNGDDQLQNAIFNLSEGQVNVDPFTDEVKNEAVSDAQQASSALQNMLLIFWKHLSSTSGGAGELASLVRNFLADTAEMVEQQAGSAKVQLRETEEEVQQGKRDPLGREHVEDEDSGDQRRRFESGMDTAKSTGSRAIGAGQSVKRGVDELSDKTSQNLENLLDAILERAQNDPAYRDSVSTVFDLASKWFNKSVDAVDTKSVDDFVHDPSGRIPSAISSLNSLVERLAGGKSTQDLKLALRAVAMDVRDDPELRSYFDDLNDFARRTVHEPTYARSEEHDQRRQELCDRWDQLQSGEKRRKWHDDMKKLKSDASGYLKLIEQDRDVQRLRKAYLTLSNDFAEAAATLNQAAMGDANWLWQDFVDVVLPRVLQSLRQLPIPRTEYKDTEVEFVIEDLNISSLRLLPGQAHVRNTTDMDVSKQSQGAEASTSVKSHTQIHLRAVRFKANDVSFWYHDETMKPISEVSGLMGIDVPEQGVDVDISLGLIPQPSKKASDSHQHAFFTVELVKVKLNNPSFSIRKSNHPVLFTAFKPMVRSRLESSIETSLANQISTGIQLFDELAFDVHRRAGVFSDTGMGTSASYMSAIWSEIGHMKGQPGFLSGLQTTSVGVVRDDPRTDAKFAMGAQPQIIPGEKHGPEVPGSNAQARRAQAVRLAEEAKGRDHDAGERAESGVSSFMEEVRIKMEQENRSEGWKTSAFDAPAC